MFESTVPSVSAGFVQSLRWKKFVPVGDNRMRARWGLGTECRMRATTARIASDTVERTFYAFRFEGVNRYDRAHTNFSFRMTSHEASVCSARLRLMMQVRCSVLYEVYRATTVR